LADDRLEAFYDNPNALRDYFRDLGGWFLPPGGAKLMIYNPTAIRIFVFLRSEERVRRNAENELVWRLLPEKKKKHVTIEEIMQSFCVFLYSFFFTLSLTATLSTLPFPAVFRFVCLPTV